LRPREFLRTSIVGVADPHAAGRHCVQQLPVVVASWVLSQRAGAEE
jgi:hypothetical protein